MATIRYTALPDSIDLQTMATTRGIADKPNNPVMAEVRIFHRFHYRVDWDRGYVWVMDLGAPGRTDGAIAPCIAEIRIEKCVWPPRPPDDAKAHAISRARAAAEKAVQEYLAGEEEGLGE